MSFFTFDPYYPVFWTVSTNGGGEVRGRLSELVVGKDERREGSPPPVLRREGGRPEGQLAEAGGEHEEAEPRRPEDLAGMAR